MATENSRGRAGAELDDMQPLIEHDNADTEAEDEDVLQLRGYLDRSKKARLRRNVFVLAGITVLVVGIIISVHFWKKHRHSTSTTFIPPSSNSTYLIALRVLQVTSQEPHFFPEHQPKRTQIKYGPMKVPGRGHYDGMKNFKLKDVVPPCRGCMIVWMHAGLEFLHGGEAEPKHGMWLHHTVLQNNARVAAKGCWDGKKEKEGKKERFFASGNEKTVVDLGVNGTEKVGYWIGEKDHMSMSTELMNMNKESQTAVLTLTFEYIPYQPHDFSSTTPIWMDIGGCHSMVPVPSGGPLFEIESPVWTSTINGRIATVLGHLHDGGERLSLHRDSKEVCDIKAAYGMKNEFEHHDPDMDMSHITSMSTCNSVGRLTVGEEWMIKAHYNLEKHEPMLNGHGQPEPIMGIDIMYVVKD
ncbi:hypothetical protein BP5796_12058 [Coleophoma crateriformis]|uniref:Uncharacterized protein n=1 Tax=Coleophoma crateriformis TaxID=565419 RepID=A0A3D8QCF6_9HELO|nr:hypothetical protein BP5796_12058 [Coleophoma crateriformis]